MKSRKRTRTRTRRDLSPRSSVWVSPWPWLMSTLPLMMTLHESSSSPSFMTTVPAFSTTAKTITRHSARRTDSVILANARKCCVNSSNTWKKTTIFCLKKWFLPWPGAVDRVSLSLTQLWLWLTAYGFSLTSAIVFCLSHLNVSWCFLLTHSTDFKFRLLFYSVSFTGACLCLKNQWS